MSTTENTYPLGHDEHELRRLEAQAATLAPATSAILTLAGIQPGMRVLDLGTGAGDVAFEVARMVGPSGRVLGIDQSAHSLDWAAHRSEAYGLTNVSFVQGDLHEVRITEPVDAVVGRLVLLYAPDPVRLLRRFTPLVRPGGPIVAMEYVMTAAGMVPPGALSDRVGGWFTEAFRRAGLDPSLGARLQGVFAEAGLAPATVLGMQTYHPTGDPTAGQMMAGVARTLLPLLTGTGIATEAEIDLDTLEQRVNDEQSASGAIFKPPTLVGAWARVTPAA